MGLAHTNLLGLGLYSFKQAERYTGIPSKTLKRWFEGYERSGIKYDSIWSSQLKENSYGVTGITFNDMIEARFAHVLQLHGLSAKTIRRTVEIAKEMFKTEHPLSYKQFYTDGRGIFTKLIEEDEDSVLIDIAKKQTVFNKVIKPSLKDVVYKNNIVDLWHPEGNKNIIISPKYALGKPVIKDSFIPTEVLHSAFLVEDDTKYVAELYETSEKLVKAAIKFESNL